MIWKRPRGRPSLSAMVRDHLWIHIVCTLACEDTVTVPGMRSYRKLTVTKGHRLLRGALLSFDRHLRCVEHSLIGLH